MWIQVSIFWRDLTRCECSEKPASPVFSTFPALALDLATSGWLVNGTTPPPQFGPDCGPFLITCISCLWTESPGSLSSLLLISSRSFCKQFLAWEERARGFSFGKESTTTHPPLRPFPAHTPMSQVLFSVLAGKTGTTQVGLESSLSYRSNKIIKNPALVYLTFQLGRHTTQCEMLRPQVPRRNIRKKKKKRRRNIRQVKA